MRHFASLTVIVSLVLISALSSTTRADDLIYANDHATGYAWAPGAWSELFDYGSSPGGKVSKFTFRYSSTASTSITVRFYRNLDTRDCDPGWIVKTITLSNVPGTGGFYRDHTQVLSEAERFDLPAGQFGYSFESPSSSLAFGLASGGTGNQDELWQYDSWFGYYYAFYFDNSWAGLYMKIYKAPPIELVTCDITGYKFDDANGNGARDAGEPYMPGWDIYLDTNNDGIHQVSEPNAVTDPNGLYLFKHLPAPATYRVREVMQNGWTQTWPGGSALGYVIAAEPNNVYANRNFGNTQMQANGSISGKCFNDSNANSQYNVGEPGLSGWIVYVDANKNSKLDAAEKIATTDASGAYQLSGLSMGTHVIAIQMQSGWVGTYPTAACSHSVTLTPQTPNVARVDFGNNQFLNYGGGQGTVLQPYLISTPLHLQAIGAHKGDWGKHFKLMADISLAKYKNQEFNLIGRYNFEDQLTPFSGTFDGNGFSILDFTYEYTDEPQEFIGLFGYVCGGFGEVRDLQMSNVNVKTAGGGVDTGAMVGWLRTGSLLNCHVGGGKVRTEASCAGGLVGNLECLVTACTAAVDVESFEGQAGGLVGYNGNGGRVMDCSASGTIIGYSAVGGLVGNNGSLVVRCYAAADVTGFQYVGGLVGENSGGTVRQCCSQGVVRTVYDHIYGLEGTEGGGLAGRNIAGGTLADCYSEAQVVGGKTIGGLLGLTWGSTGPCQVTNCYSVGAVSGTSSVGGLIGNVNNSSVTGCFWDVQASGKGTSAGGVGRTTPLMKSLATYQSAGWDTGVWRICDGLDYPRLRWEYAAGDLDCPDGVGMEDLAYLAGRWLMEGTAAEGADIDGDGVVNMADYAVLPAEWYGEEVE